MGNKVKFGLEKVHVAFVDEEGTDQPAWQAPEKIDGAVNFSSSPEGDETEFYADNTKYFVHETNDGYEGDLELANIPDDIISEMLGMEIDDNDMLVERTDDDPKEFALMAQMKGDDRDRRFVFYRCKASRPDQEAATNEGSVDPQTDSIPLTMMPIDEGEDEGVVKAVIEDTGENTDAYNAFFDEVVTPNQDFSA